MGAKLENDGSYDTNAVNNKINYTERTIISHISLCLSLSLSHIHTHKQTQSLSV